MQNGETNFMSHNPLRKASQLVIVSVLIFFNSAALATWNKVAQFPVTVDASFFFDEQRGFIALDGANGIKRTSDGGQTWINCSIPNGFAGYFTDIFMKDSLHGWVSIEDVNTAHGLWSTSDGGVSWQINPSIIGPFSSVYQTSSCLIVNNRLNQSDLLFSTDGGLSFIRTGSDNYNGINFTDDLHGVTSAFKGSSGYAPALFTNDGGRTWSNTSGVLVEAWSVYAERGTPNFFIVGEKVASDPSIPENVYASTDYGATWKTINVINTRTTGHVAGGGQTIYVQCLTPLQSNATQTGLIRSTDAGKTWMFVGGPSNYRDTRFSVTGCNGATVYAFDESGGVWKTNDGGDGAIKELLTSPSLTPNQISLSSSLCNSVTASLTYANLTCNALRIESIGFSDSTNAVVSKGALSFIRYPKLPQNLNADSEDSLVLKWDPKNLGTQKLITKAFIKVHGSIPGSSVVFDTLLEVDAESFAPQPESRPATITFAATKVDSQSCTTFVLKNSAAIGSTPFILLSIAPPGNDTVFASVPLFTSLPLSVAAQDSVTIQVCFYPPDSSLHLDSLIVKTDCMNFSIGLDGQGSTGLISAGDLDFGSVRIGDTVCKNILVKNIGSSPFIIITYLLSDTADFSIDPGFAGALVYEGTNISIGVCFHPKSEGVISTAIDWATDLNPKYASSVKTISALSGKGIPPAGVKSILIPNSFSICPNPTLGEIDINLSGDQNQKPPIEIFDALGKKVFSEPENIQSGMNIIHIDTRNLPAGIYVVRVGHASQNFVKE
jgi:photosystem II stability/assembly factor-like uncharacterized protein